MSICVNNFLDMRHPEVVPSGGDGVSTHSHTELSVTVCMERDEKHLQLLEAEVARQQQLLSEATQFLQEAAYLARYHQPSLERHIRAFLDQVSTVEE